MEAPMPLEPPVTRAVWVERDIVVAFEGEARKLEALKDGLDSWL